MLTRISVAGTSTGIPRSVLIASVLVPAPPPPLQDAPTLVHRKHASTSTQAPAPRPHALKGACTSVRAVGLAITANTRENAKSLLRSLVEWAPLFSGRHLLLTRTGSQRIWFIVIVIRFLLNLSIIYLTTINFHLDLYLPTALIQTPVVTPSLLRLTLSQCPALCPSQLGTIS